MKQTMVITGGSEGLGKAMAEHFSKDFNVSILSFDEKRLKQVSKKCGCDFEVCDVTKPDEVEKAVKNITKKFGKVDILINNAGVWIEGNLEENDYDRISKVVDVNLKGVMNVTKAVIPQMKKRKSGLIININSQAGIISKAQRSVYNASKWGVTGFTKCLQAEVSQFGVRVTDVMPSLIKTKLFKNAGNARDFKNSLEAKDVVKLVEFVVSLPKEVHIPEVGIKNVLY